MCLCSLLLAERGCGPVHGWAFRWSLSAVRWLPDYQGQGSSEPIFLSVVSPNSRAGFAMFVQIPVYLVWIYWATPFSWVIRALVR